MKSAIDSAGRIVIPASIRNAIGLEPGTVVDFDIRDGAVIMEPAPAEVKIVKRGKLWVATFEAASALSDDQVRATRDEVRKRR